MCTQYSHTTVHIKTTQPPTHPHTHTNTSLHMKTTHIHTTYVSIAVCDYSIHITIQFMPGQTEMKVTKEQTVQPAQPPWLTPEQ